MALIIMVIAMIAGLKIRNDINLVFENDLGDYRVSYKLEEIVEENAEGITKELESLFYNQYGEAFQVLEIEYQGPDTIGGSLIRLKPLEHPEIKVTGFIYKYGSVKDDYGDYLKKDAIVRQVQEVVDEVYPISKVIYEAGWKFIPYSTSEDMTVSEYSRCFEKGLRVDIYV